MRLQHGLLLGLCYLSLAACAPAAEQELKLTAGRFKLPLPGKTLSAGYFELHNATSRDQILVQVTAAIGSSVEIHRTLQEGDQVRMVRVPEVPLAAGDSIRFAPGGYHLMLFGIDSLPEQTPVTLHFASGDSLAATFVAERW